ncbi:polyprenyl synthetase family protein [Flavitalea sp. BT771]|uniref:polyprenyl synthetase family protein n=1 Tax=Flavitalea sp. BT771 TaxID=3063329 RepID=UPI0026E278D6|nr:polyprenyl synthetase family protein [Flavitalea sp. BT771]MDO6434667.1 polyprenyl synthetase family protein [Flavitalea sp. BT771]MDV6223567.1 polyprenyl synthetase family protein [Flavitalea sp. BT771]
MHSFEALSAEFTARFQAQHFPSHPATLYEPANYFLGIGGKRIRPVLCLMGNELFGDIDPDAWHLAASIELFHNFTLIHDDIMDKAPLRRGKPTVHEKYGASTALLTGDVMMVVAYDYLSKIQAQHIRPIMHIYNQTAREVCEGQQLDMDFERMERVGLKEYQRMIGLKTSVLLAASLRIGAILGGAGLGNQQHIYEFGKNLGLAFQVQDDYLDAFGDPEKFGKQVGGDIVAGKKTFLLIKTLEVATDAQRREMIRLTNADAATKVEGMLQIFEDCGVDAWARELKEQYMEAAHQQLEDIAVLDRRKEPLRQLAAFLVQREY